MENSSVGLPYSKWLLSPQTTTVARMAAVILIIALSSVPGELRPHTGLPGPFEHFIAYFLTGLVFASGSRSLRHLSVMIAGLVVLAGAMEILQNFVPNRSPQVIDFFVSSLGALCGAFSGLPLRKVIRADPA